MKPFGYARDPLFLLSCLLYALNRWIVKPYLPTGFFHSHFNDLLLIPCALPLMLLLHRKLGLRSHDRIPSASEILLHLAVWAIFCEFLGPLWFTHTTGDPRDVIAYASGALLAGLWWHRGESHLPATA